MGGGEGAESGGIGGAMRVCGAVVAAIHGGDCGSHGNGNYEWLLAVLHYSIVSTI